MGQATSLRLPISRHTQRLNESSKSPPSYSSSSTIDSLTDDEVYDLISNIQRERDAVDYDRNIDIDIPPVFRITSDAVAKKVSKPQRNEDYVMQYVAARTDIRIPTIRRVLPAKDDANKHWIIMDYVCGRNLLDLWPRMNWWRRLSVVWTLRQYLRQLHRAPLPNPGVPGPFDGTGEPLQCYAPHFPWDGAGPFSSYNELAQWHDYQRYCHQVRRHQIFGAIWKCPVFDMSSPLVLCHGDLHFRNIMVDEDSRVWLVDWANAGAFPAWWDYVHLASWADATNCDRRLPKSFSIFLRFIAGNYGQLYKTYWDVLTKQIDNVDREPLEEVVGYFEKLGIDVSAQSDA